MASTPRDFRSSLISLGFSEKEAAVFLALLELGRATVSKVARNAGINRVTAYVVLDSLIAKGLVRLTGKEPKQEYETETPDRLPEMLNRERKRLDEKLAYAEALALELKSVRKSSTRPQIRFYEGEKGMRQVYEDTLSAHESIRAYASVDDFKAVWPDYINEYVKSRAKKRIFARAIFPDTKLTKELIVNDKRDERESVLVPTKTYGFHPEINIYDNKVMIASWREELGIIIESSEIADAMKKIFELAWAEAKRLDASLRGKEAEAGV